MTTSKLKGKVAIVTGASKGIGAQVAKDLAAAGAAVVVNYAADQAGADRVVAEIVAADGRAIAVRADVTVKADVERLFAEAIRTFGAPSVIVNNAGVYKFDPIEQVTVDEIHRQLDINVTGPLLVIQEAVRHLGAGGGSVINVSSIASQSPPGGTVVYSASKAALDAATQALARELGPRRIRVNSVLPGPTITEGLHTAGIVGSPFLDHMVNQTPLGRAAAPSDVAPLIAFLASDDAAWITGETIRASGGLW